MRPSPAALVFFVLAIIVSLATNAAAQSPVGWTTHTDAKGFAMLARPGWTVASDARAGRLAGRGPKNEPVPIWPGSVQQPLDQRGAAELGLQLARQIDAQAPWSAAAASGPAVRPFAKAQQRSAAA